MKCVILLALLCCVFGGPVEDVAFQEFVNGNHKFSADVYKGIFKNQQGNFIFSPLSAEVILALTNEGAKGETSAELVAGLSLPSSKEKTRKAIKSILPNLKKSDGELQLLSANKIYTGKGLKLEDDFKSIATTVYDSGVEGVDFRERSQASSTINNWVENNTNRKIKNLIKPDDIGDGTRIILVNALYFSGNWVSKFKEYLTDQRKFFVNKHDSVDTVTMHQTGHFNYYENPTLNTKFLELKYESGDISMVIALPNEKEGLKSLEQNVEQLLAPQPFVNERVDVWLPKFTTETEIKFVPILKNLGVRKLFDNADLSGLFSTHKNLSVSNVIQKAFINVTESGTEAAAATAVVGLGSSGSFYSSDPLPFHADHPFMYFIKSNGVILFVGRYTNP